MDRDLFVHDFDADMQLDAIPSVASPEIARIADSFTRNLQTSVRVLGIPRLLLLIGIYREDDIGLFLKAISEDAAYLSWSESEQTRRAVEARLRDLRSTEGASEETRARRTAQVSEQIDRLAADADIGRVLLALVYTAISSLWTTIECLAKDLWVAAVNSRPIAMAQSVFSSLPRQESDADVSRRSVSVGLLARYGFDLRSQLGTVLASKFDFTSASGINEAFMVAFNRDPGLEKILATQGLQRLEAARHLVVHRGGQVDADYLRRTGKSVQLGHQLDITANELGEHARSIRDAGTELLRYVDNWLLNTGASTTAGN